MESMKALLCLIVFSSLLFLGCSYKITEPHPILNISSSSSANASVNLPVNPSADKTNQPANPSVGKSPQNTSSQTPTLPASGQGQAPNQGQPAATVSQNETGTLETHDRYLLLLPEHQNMLNDSIIIVGFSPSGDADSIMNAWRPAAEKRGWPVFTSKTFHNGELPMTFDSELISDIGNVSSRLWYIEPKFVFTGVSGGGQLSQAFAFGHPSIVAAVVTNCGIINPGYWNFTKYYPHNKVAFFIASPTDFRYEQMKKDRDFLSSIGWKTGWVEFEGGHALAPTSTYEQVAVWLEQTIGNSTN